MPSPYPGFGDGYYVQGGVTVGLWAKKAGAWQLVTTRYVFVNQEVYSQGQHTVNWSLFETVDLGAGVEAFGVTVESFDSGSAAAVTDLASVSWSAQAASGERSATPSGQSSTVVISPQ